MVQVSVKEYIYTLLQNLGEETIIKEYKEFYLRKALTIYDYYDLQKGILTSKVQHYVEQTLEYYFDKYFKKYICSLTNIDKHFLQNILAENFSNFYIGVSDEGIITGIPINKDYLPKLVKTIEEKLSIYYKDIIGLHNKKGVKEIQIGEETYYDFDKLLVILKKYTNVKIHILKKENKKNEEYKILNSHVQETLEEEEIYEQDRIIHKQQKLDKKKYNDKYSTSFHKLIRSDDIMLEFKEYLENLKLDNYPFDKLLSLLKSKILMPCDVEKYLFNGEYIVGSLSLTEELDKYYGIKIQEFLHYYKEFKAKMLSDNIYIKPFSKKSPKLKLNSYLKNITCFTEQFYPSEETIYIMIQIELPFIKDKNVYVGLKDKKNVKIIKRTYEDTMNMPCTQTN